MGTSYHAAWCWEFCERREARRIYCGYPNDTISDINKVRIAKRKMRVVRYEYLRRLDIIQLSPVAVLICFRNRDLVNDEVKLLRVLPPDSALSFAAVAIDPDAIPSVRSVRAIRNRALVVSLHDGVGLPLAWI